MTGRYQILQGDVIDGLKTLPSESVHCCVTSPPYWGLRDYGVPGQIGLEPTLDAYVQTMVEVFREVRRVLRSDGTLWLNLGDSYAGGKCGRDDHGVEDSSVGLAGNTRNAVNVGRGVPRKPTDGLKPKDLCMVPARVALALQADGWWLRSEIVWAKKAPMPESVTDRPTSAHEKIYLLTKSSSYYYDADAVREKTVTPLDSTARQSFGSQNGKLNDGEKAHSNRMGEFQEKRADRNLRNVWHLSPEPFAEAHFATFPTIIPKRAILAGSSERGVCPCCGKGWVRVVEHEKGDAEAVCRPKHLQSAKSTLSLSGNGSKEWAERGGKRTEIGWQPACPCNVSEVVPATVLDPFLGSGTTVAVALSLGRRGIGIEINPEYVTLAEKRIAPYAAQEVLTF